MSKALVIKGASFAANALDVVTFTEPTPCTGVTLSENTLSMTSVGSTHTLTATLAPADTTDTLSWLSSDDSVATVNNGVVTATGLGSATITAKCGNITASCAVTVTQAFSAVWGLGTHATVASGANHISLSTLTSAAIAYSETGVLATNYLPNVSTKIYPIIIPNGCKKISISAQGCIIGYTFSNSATEGDAAGNVGVISSAAVGSSSTIRNSVVLDVPNGADCWHCIVRTINESAADQTLINSISIQYLTA